ncbi:MAG: hypothetical protein JWN70_6359 [Planctomycetaceae bacterium]|nr:hypothetical protein [Planctomycetaceae bacterium]
MPTIDFSRSFLTFRIDTLKKPPQTVSHQPPYSLNNARIQLDSVCDITEKATGTAQRFVLGASCKTERVGVKSDIWTVPNADFVPVISTDRFLNIKSYAYLGQEQTVQLYGHNRPQPDRQTGDTAVAFDTLKIHVHESAGEWLETPEAIIAATYAHHPLTACTEYETDRYRVALYYPVKTFNVNERDNVYQTDTGPVLFPDLTREPADLITGMELTYTAFNCPEWIEFLVRVANDVPGGAKVYHYSKSLRLDGVRNRLFRV